MPKHISANRLNSVPKAHNKILYVQQVHSCLSQLVVISFAMFPRWSMQTCSTKTGKERRLCFTLMTMTLIYLLGYAFLKFVCPCNLSLPFSGSGENNKRCFFMTQYNVFLLPHDVIPLWCIHIYAHPRRWNENWDDIINYFKEWDLIFCWCKWFHVCSVNHSAYVSIGASCGKRTWRLRKWKSNWRSLYLCYNKVKHREKNSYRSKKWGNKLLQLAWLHQLRWLSA